MRDAGDHVQTSTIFTLPNIANNTLPDATSLGICALDMRHWYTGEQQPSSSWVGRLSMMQATANSLLPLLSPLPPSVHRGFCASLYDHTHFRILSLSPFSVATPKPWRKTVGENFLGYDSSEYVPLSATACNTKDEPGTKESEERALKLMQGTRAEGDSRDSWHILVVSKPRPVEILCISIQLLSF
jgi:hypothetical protein